MEEVMGTGHAGSRTIVRKAATVLVLAIATFTTLTGCVDQGDAPSPRATSTLQAGLPSTAPTAPVDAGKVFRQAPRARRQAPRERARAGVGPTPLTRLPETYLAH